MQFLLETRSMGTSENVLNCKSILNFGSFLRKHHTVSPVMLFSPTAKIYSGRKWDPDLTVKTSGCPAKDSTWTIHPKPHDCFQARYSPAFRLSKNNFFEFLHGLVLILEHFLFQNLFEANMQKLTFQTLPSLNLTFSEKKSL